MSKRKARVCDSREGYNLAASAYDKKESYLNSFEKGELLALLGPVKGKKILDVGAGTGRLSGKLFKAGAVVTALDVSEGMLAELKSKHKGVLTIVGDAEQLPFPNGSFDVVVAAFLIVHLKDPTRFFDEVYRVLQDGGVFVVTNINQKDPPKIETSEGTIVIESYYHRPERVREILEHLAFRIENELFVREGEHWVNQIIVAKK